MKKIFKLIFVPIFCIVFAAGCSQLLPIIPSIIDGGGDDPQTTQKVCGLLTDSSNTGLVDSVTSSRLSAGTSYKDAAKSTVKIAACYTINSNEYDTQASGFIFDKLENTETHTYTYYVATSSSGIFYRYITSGGSEWDVEKNTNVLRDGVFEFTLNDGQKIAGSVVGYFDPYDVAVLKFESKHEYDVIEFGDSDQIGLGDYVYGYGTPLRGYNLYNTLMRGAVSGLNRLTTVGYTSTYMSVEYSGTVATYNAFQIDAAFNIGMEGGPLVNATGQLVGMLGYRYAGSSEYESMGFAIQSNDLRNILSSIVDGGSYTKPMLGIYVSDISNYLTNSKSAWLSQQNIYKGVYVVYNDGIIDGGAAKAAGMVADCVLTSIENDGKTYELINMASLYSVLVRVDKTKPLIVHATLNDGSQATYTVNL